MSKVQTIGVIAPIIYLGIDVPVFSIEGRPLGKTSFKEYSTKTFLTKNVQEDPTNSDRLVVIAKSDSGEMVEMNFDKYNHIPSGKEGDLFLDDNQALKAIRKLIKSDFDACKENLEILGNLKDLYDNKTSIAPEKFNKRQTFIIQDTEDTPIEKVHSKRFSDEKEEN
jgi:hypothetical protein